MEGFGERVTGKIIISGISSSSGKTLISCGLLGEFRRRNLKICAYKTGPDYIDTEYLRRSGNCEAYNLDTWLMNEESTLKLFNQTSRNKDIILIEGAMGLFDGGTHSTARIAKLLNIPIILVLNAKSLGESAAAIVSGFCNYDKNINIAGVILNFIASDYHEKIITDELNKINVKVLGVVRRDEKFKIPERHLGLLQVSENANFNPDFDIKKYVNVDEIIKIAYSDKVKSSATVSIAKDEAFTFYYPESLETLKTLGAELKFFSPIHDKKIPDSDICIFGGGYPEIFARELSQNLSMLESVRNFDGKILAECGGLMYLCKTISDLEGEKFSMAGLIPFDSFMTEKPVIGYIEAKALKDNILCEKNKIIRGHEFHYSRLEPEISQDTAAFEFTRRRTGVKTYGGYSEKNILASYLHINFFGNSEMAERLLF